MHSVAMFQGFLKQDSGPNWDSQAVWNFRKENQWQYNAGHTSCIWVEDKKQLSFQLWFKTYKNNGKKDRCDLLTDFIRPYAPQFSACIERKLQGVHNF